MRRNPRNAWILDASYRLPTWGQRLVSRFCRFSSLTVAVALGLALLAAPWLPIPSSTNLGTRVLVLFAEDSIVRRCGVVSALGLWVTAVVFFRDSRRFPFHRRRATD